MNGFHPVRPPIRFGLYEADLRARELRKQGHPVKLSNTAFQILAALLVRPRDVVSRTELIQKLPSHGTARDFERVVNDGMRELQQALEDRAEDPRFIETLGENYRFLGLAALRAADLGIVNNRRVRLCWWYECGGEVETDFGDRASATEWLRQFKPDAVRMSVLRSLAAEGGYSQLHHMGDNGVIRFIADLIFDGRLRVYQRPLATYVGPTGAEAQQPKPAPAVEPARVATPKPQAVESPTFVPLDAVAQVAVLLAAAAQGVPFCEE